MENEHLDTIPATESDEFIKSSVEILVPIPSESKGVPKVCDVPFHDNSPPLDISKDQSEDFSDSNVDSTSTDEDSFSSNDVEYVEASPPNSEPVSSKVMEIVIPEVGRIEDDILLIKDDTLREKLLNVNRLVAKIEALKDNPVPSSVVVTKSTSTFPDLFLEETNTFDNSLPELETFCFNLEEPSSGSPTTHSELSLPDYKAFYIDNDHFKEKSSGKEVDINKKTENQAKMTKLSMEWKWTVKNQGPSQKMPKSVNTEESAVKPEPELKNTIGCNLYPSDGPGKPNSISMKTVKTKWALNQLQQPICVQLTKTVKTLKAQS
ncbi:hypothetical protein Tco_1509532 [Tanacetum coccineum]